MSHPKKRRSLWALKEFIARREQRRIVELLGQLDWDNTFDPKAQAQIIERFQALPLLQPSGETHIAAARLRNERRRSGVWLGTIDALIAQLCIEHDLMLLTTDDDFVHAARHVPLRLAV